MRGGKERERSEIRREETWVGGNLSGEEEASADQQGLDSQSRKRSTTTKRGMAPDPVSAVPVTGSPGTNHFLLHANHDTTLSMDSGTNSESNFFLSLYHN